MSDSLISAPLPPVDWGDAVCRHSTSHTHHMHDDAGGGALAMSIRSWMVKRKYRGYHLLTLDDPIFCIGQIKFSQMNVAYRWSLSRCSQVLVSSLQDCYVRTRTQGIRICARSSGNNSLYILTVAGIRCVLMISVFKILPIESFRVQTTLQKSDKTLFSFCPIRF